MKITVINNDVMFENETGTFIDNRTGPFIAELGKLTEEVFFLHFRMKFGISRRMADYRIDDKGITINAIKRGRGKAIPYLKLIFVGYQQIRKSDFLYAFYPGNICIIMSFFAIIQGKPFGLYVRGEKGITSRVSKFLYKRASVIFTISPQFTNIIKAYSTNVETIRPMIEYAEQDIVKGRKYVKKDKYKLLYVGRLEKRKGSYDLIDAVNWMLEHESKSFVLNVVGDGPETLEIQKYATDLGLQNTIIFHGAVTDPGELKDIYLNADLFVFPSHDEGFPRVLYEAAILGTPIATTFVGTVGYLMKDNYNCYRLPVKDFKGIGDILFNILQQYESVLVIAQNATQTIEDYLNANKYPHEQQLINALETMKIN